jgi:hypothetical protein
VGNALYWDFDIFKCTIVTGIDEENKKMKIMPMFGKIGFTKPMGVTPSDVDLQNIQAYLKTLGPRGMRLDGRPGRPSSNAGRAKRGDRPFCQLSARAAISSEAA